MKKMEKNEKNQSQMKLRSIMSRISVGDESRSMEIEENGCRAAYRRTSWTCSWAFVAAAAGVGNQASWVYSGRHASLTISSQRT
jgi:hypothetical protein